MWTNDMVNRKTRSEYYVNAEKCAYTRQKIMDFYDNNGQHEQNQDIQNALQDLKMQHPDQVLINWQKFSFLQ